MVKTPSTDAAHFLNSRADCVTQPLGDLAGPQTFGSNLIDLSVGSVAS